MPIDKDRILIKNLILLHSRTCQKNFQVSVLYLIRPTEVFRDYWKTSESSAVFTSPGRNIRACIFGWSYIPW